MYQLCSIRFDHYLDFSSFLSSLFGRAFALETENLKRLQVTHVLNAAQCRGINSNPRMYTDAGFHFFGVMALDRIECDISQFFNTAADFIESAVKANGEALYLIF